MPWLKCKVAFLFVQFCVCAAFQGLCSPGQAKKSPLCRPIEAQSATQSQFQGIPVRPNAKVSPKSVRQLPWQLGKPVKLCMIFQQLHPSPLTYTLTHTSLALAPEIRQQQKLWLWCVHCFNAPHSQRQFAKNAHKHTHRHIPTNTPTQYGSNFFAGSTFQVLTNRSLCEINFQQVKGLSADVRDSRN